MMLSGRRYVKSVHGVISTESCEHSDADSQQ